MKSQTETQPQSAARRLLVLSTRWLDSDYFPEGLEAVRNQPDKIDIRRCMPFLFLHLGCLGVFFVGCSKTALLAALFLYLTRMFAVTGFYHRYFSHKTFSTSRAGQFILAVLGNSSVQRGPLWWASVHRHHHKHADQEEDTHSPGMRGFWWAHIGWMTSSRNLPTDYSRVKDMAKFPELVFINRFDLLVPICLALGLYGLGDWLSYACPNLETNGRQILIWGFFVSTVVLLHATLCINSFAHLFGKRRYSTEDDSRNSLILALITLGEGWHNNHHRYMASARQGFYWWEIDITYYLLYALSWTGLIWGLKPVPQSVYEKAAPAFATSI